MPTAAETFQGIVGPQDGPFSQNLHPAPRPIDAPQQGASGWETGPVGAGEVALGFLKGVRQQRLANALEEDKNTQSQLDNFRAYTNSRLQDPDLTDEGRQAILSQANGIMNQHMHYEMRDVPKHGVAGFFKNLLTQASGGPIKAREPINWDQATGQVTNAVRPEHSQKANYQSALNEATQALDGLKSSGQVVMPSQVEAVLAPILSKVAMGAPNYVNVFQNTVKALAPGNQFAEEMERKKINILRGGGDFGAAAPQGQPTAAPPQLNYSPVAGATPAQPNVRPADAAAAPPSMDLRNPVNRALLKDFGYKLEDPDTIYNPANLSQFISNVTKHPVTGKWLDANMQELRPDMQGWVPHDQVKTPTTSDEVVISGSNTPGGTPELMILNKATNTTRPITANEKKIYGLTGYEETMLNNQRVAMPRTPGMVVAPPAENAGAAHAQAVTSQGLAIRDKALTAAGSNIDAQLEWVRKNVPESEGRGKAIEFIGNPANAGKAEMFLKFLGGGTGTSSGAGAAPTAPPPTATPSAPAASGRYKRKD